MADIYEVLIEEHNKHRGLMGGLGETQGDEAERRRLFDLLKKELVAHANAEEQTFYAELIADSDSQEQARHSIAEHKTIDDIVEELDDMDFSSTGWLTRFKTLKDKVEHHMEEEEKDVFPVARTVLSQSKARDLVGAFEKRKAAEM
ncbi:MAG: hemerythrin domain-containing protein [Alphaproteobacteria bacterium]